MERITVYYNGVPIIHHPLTRDRLSIGAQPDSDLILAGNQTSDQQVVLYRGANGKWSAKPAGKNGIGISTELERDAHFSLGRFSLAVETHVGSPKSFVQSRPPRQIEGLVGTSLPIQLLKQDIVSMGALKAPVLIVGETGTGKEIVARSLHLQSEHSGGPFVPVNCGGLTESMLEDTLFGHERGAFTGAQTSRRGVFEQANGGTLFLDEIGELPVSQQASLLRVLDDKQVRRIGAEGVKRVDFRLVTATNRPLLSFTQTGEFRLDLYHRIATLEIETKPLRERPEDVEPLALHFLELIRDEIGQRVLSSSALEKLMSYSWPGNARELKNALYRAAVRTREQELKALHFELSQESQVRKRPNLLDQVSDSRIVTVLDKHRGNVAAAARDLGVPRTSLRDRAARI